MASNSQNRTRALARVMVDPDFQAATTIKAYNEDSAELSLPAIVEALQQQITQLESAGDPALGRRLLFAQARVLDGMFNHLARMALGSVYVGQMEQILRLALRAQSQSQSTVRALAELQTRKKATLIEETVIPVVPDSAFERPEFRGRTAKRTNGAN